MVPVNYRQHRLRISNKDILVGGMAAPDKRNLNPDAIIEFLNQQASPYKGVLIGLKEEQFERLANKHNLDYYHLPIPDWTPASPQTYHQLYKYIERFTAENRPITIHCGAGNGRTGTAIASLKLREILTREASINPDILNEPQIMDSDIIPSMKGTKIPCTRFVKEAVESIRTQRVTTQQSESNGSGSVETESDIQALLEYEDFIKNEIKKEYFRELIQPLIKHLDRNNIHHFIKKADDVEILLPLLTPEQYRLISNLTDLIKDNYSFGRILSSMNSEQIATLCQMMQNNMAGLISNIEQLKTVVMQLNPDQFKTFMPYLPPQITQQLLDIDSHIELFEGLSFEHRGVLLEVNMHFLPDLLKNSDQFIRFTEHLNLKELQLLLQDHKIQTKIPAIITSVAVLDSILRILNPEEFDIILDIFKENPPSIVKNASDLKLLLRNQTPEMSTKLCQIFQKSMLEQQFSASDLREVLEFQSLSQQSATLEGIQEILPQIIKTPQDLVIFLKDDNELTASKIDKMKLNLTAIKDILPHIIQDTYDFKFVFNVLPQVLHSNVLPYFKDKLPSLLHNGYDLGMMLSAIETSQYPDLFAAMHSKLINLIKTFADVSDVLFYLNPQQAESFKQSELMSRLTQYINRTESHKKNDQIDYRHGFTLFKESKAVNRKINYLLALELLNQLQSKSPDLTCFENIEKYKSAIVEKLSAEDKLNYVDRKMGSKELKEIIDKSNLYKK